MELETRRKFIMAQFASPFVISNPTRQTTIRLRMASRAEESIGAEERI
jgi:hypothetical protein